MTGIFIKKGYLDKEIHVEGRLCEETKGEDGHVQTKKRSLKEIDHWPFGARLPSCHHMKVDER